MAPSLDLVVTSVATQLMAADTKTAADLSQSILRDLVAVFDVDASFLRQNDHGTRVTKLVAEWPTRDNVPDPDPLGDVSFENADPVFAMLEHLKEPIVLRPDPITDEYGHRVERAKGIPVISMAVAPLLAQGVTTGALGFIKFDDREWSIEELNAVQAIASMFAQLHGRLIAEDRLRFLADHDDLTNLFNRRALMAHLDHRLADGEPDRVSVLLLDLDRLKTLNDYLGHVSGDQFIRVVAERLRDSQGDSAVVGRLGGDEFVVIPAETVDTDDVEMLADRLRHEIQRGVTVGGEIIKRTVSIGVAFGTPGSDSASEVIQRADEALLVAKKSGGDRSVVFSQAMFASQSLRTDVELHLQQGIEDDALTLHYLPEVDLRTGKILAVEALVRWLHPTRGLLAPDAFIGVAESINLAGELGRWVLRTACAQWAQWRSEGIDPELALRVNVSPAQLVTANFADEVGHILDEFMVPASALCLEITESVFQDVEVTRKGLLAVRDLGVRLAIDDFGTGYSSLSYLKSLPVDVIKIDKGFVLRLADDEDDRAIVRSTIGLAEAFQLEVVAEGVETTTAADLLLEYGCHRAQGFLLSRPIDSTAATALLKSGRIDGWPPA